MSMFLKRALFALALLFALPLAAQTITGPVVNPWATGTHNTIGTRFVEGRTAAVTVNASDITVETLIATAAPADAVRFAIQIGYDASATSPTFFGQAASVADSNAATINASTSTNMTFADSGATTLAPAPAVSRRKVIWSDWMILPSAARTDGFSGGLYVARIYMAAGTTVLAGNGSQSFTNWASHPSGRYFRCREATGNYATANWSTFPSVTNTSKCLIVGVQYQARGKVQNLAGFGDSISEGQGTYIGAGFGFDTAVALSNNGAGVAYEWSNRGWAGIASPQIRTQVIDDVAQSVVRRGDVVFLPVASPNDISTTISASNITASRANLGVAAFNLENAGAKVIRWTWLPSNTSIKAYGSTDSFRRSYNNEWRALANKGLIVADFDAVIAGVADGSGQIQMKVGKTNDNIHPNDSGNADMSVIAQRAVNASITPIYGQLIN